MIFTNRTKYAIRALSELAARPGDEHVLLDDLANRTNLSRSFLANVFQQLVRMGILRSAKGRNGGFWLARPPNEISLLDIVVAIDGAEFLDRCVGGLKECTNQTACPHHDLYEPIRQRLKDYMRTTSIANLAAAAQRSEGKPASKITSRRGGRTGPRS